MKRSKTQRRLEWILKQTKKIVEGNEDEVSLEELVEALEVEAGVKSGWLSRKKHEKFYLAAKNMRQSLIERRRTDMRIKAEVERAIEDLIVKIEVDISPPVINLISPVAQKASTKRKSPVSIKLLLRTNLLLERKREVYPQMTRFWGLFSTWKKQKDY